jgi:hemerythrin-like domain-containing protein
VEAIELLTRQHREADALVARIKQGQGEERVRLLGDLAEMLTLHAALEEHYFYPLARRAGLEEEIDTSLEEHAEVKRLVSEILRAEQHSPQLDALVRRCEEHVRLHVGKEERSVFPAMRSRIAGEELASMGAEMQQAIEQLRQKELLRAAEHESTPSADLP